MITLLVLLALKVIYSSQAQDELDTEYGNLVFASVVFRHGDRSPTKLYPTDPYNETFWPDGLGQLSIRGKEQEYELGLWYRQRYDKLLGDKYHKDKIYMMSSEKDRTMMSAECFLAALYPPSQSEIWNPNLNWQPIPVHSITARIDHVIAPGDVKCKARSIEQRLITENPKYMKIYEENVETIEYVSNYTGLNLSRDDIYNTLHAVFDLYDTLFIEDLYNLTLPDWTKLVFPEKLYNLSAWDFASINASRKLIKFGIGSMLKMMIGNMTDVRDGTLHPNRTMMFYSAHDTNIASILCAVNAFKPHTPQYSSSIIIELRKKQQQYNVLMFYKFNLSVEPILINMPLCPSPCSLDDFIDAVEDIIPDNWFQECDSYEIQEISSLAIIVSVLFILTILLVLLFTMKIILRRREARRYGGYNKVVDY